MGAGREQGASEWNHPLRGCWAGSPWWDVALPPRLSPSRAQAVQGSVLGERQPSAPSFGPGAVWRAALHTDGCRGQKQNLLTAV